MAQRVKNKDLDRAIFLFDSTFKRPEGVKCFGWSDCGGCGYKLIEISENLTERDILWGKTKLALFETIHDCINTANRYEKHTK